MRYTEIAQNVTTAYTTNTIEHLQHDDTEVRQALIKEVSVKHSILMDQFYARNKTYDRLFWLHEIKKQIARVTNQKQKPSYQQMMEGLLDQYENTPQSYQFFQELTQKAKDFQQQALEMKISLPLSNWLDSIVISSFIYEFAGFVQAQVEGQEAPNLDQMLRVAEKEYTAHTQSNVNALVYHITQYLSRTGGAYGFKTRVVPQYTHNNILVYKNPIVQVTLVTSKGDYEFTVYTKGDRKPSVCNVNQFGGRVYHGLVNYLREG